jgi:LDH2 family malate/lactate/ureidoglycolate dehydrogenase
MNGGSLLPFAGHKGYGIAVAIELLTGMLADASLDHEISHPHKELAKPGMNTFFMSALRIDNFIDPERFMIRMDEWIRSIRAIRKSEGIDRIWLPGEKEFVMRTQRLIDGIPLSSIMMNELRNLAIEAGVLFNL